MQGLLVIFQQIFIFHQMIALQKLWKMFFISSKNLFSFLSFKNSGFWIIKWGLVCENWKYGSWLMAWYTFRAQLAQNQFLGPRPQIEGIF